MRASRYCTFGILPGIQVVILSLMAALLLSPCAARAADLDFVQTELRIKVTRVKHDHAILAAAIEAHQYLDDLYDIYYPKFRTPGNGTTYTLLTLAPLASAYLEAAGDDYILRGPIEISAGDELRLMDGRLLIADRTTTGTVDTRTLMPMLVIKGKLHAENFELLSLHHPESYQTEDGTSGAGILAVGPVSESQGRVTLMDCSIRGIALGVIGTSGADISIERTTISGCFLGASATGESQLTVRDSTFKGGISGVLGSGVIGAAGKVVIDHSTFLGCGVIMQNSLEGSRVERSLFEGWNSAEERAALLAIYASNRLEHEPPIQVQEPMILNNTISRYYMGIFCSGASPFVESNTIEGNAAEGIIVGWSAAPTFRNNLIRGNFGMPEVTDPYTTHTLSGIIVMHGSAADFGLTNAPGQNVIMNNGPIALHYANSSTQTLQAVGNTWDFLREPDEVERLIYHQPDDLDDSDGSGFLSGRVNFLPLHQNKASADDIWRQYDPRRR